MIQREQMIQELMSKGMERNLMLRTVASAFHVSERSIRKQYEAIVSEIQTMVKDQRHELRAQLMARQEGIFQKAIEKGNLKTALEATRDQAKLAGLFEAEIAETKRPEAIIFKEKDFSTPLSVVPQKAASDEQ
jgi:AraC-like DNA-binding protein